MSAASKKAWADPDVRARISAAHRRRRERACFHCAYRGHPRALVPLDGIEGEFECRDERACEKRLLKQQNPAA